MLEKELLDPESLAERYRDIHRAVNIYFDPGSGHIQHYYPDSTFEELVMIRDDRLRELDRSFSLTMLTAVEAAFQVDVELRVRSRKPKSRLTEDFRARNRQKKLKLRFSLERDILYVWGLRHPEFSKLFSSLKRAITYRNWLAHGRYWHPKLGNFTFHFEALYELASQIRLTIPLSRRSH